MNKIRCVVLQACLCSLVGAFFDTPAISANHQEQPRPATVAFFDVPDLPARVDEPKLRKDDQGFVITDDKMETHIPGLYVCGDVRSQYVRQISNAVGDATIAAVAATRYIEELDATGSPEEAESVERLFVQA